MARLPKPGADSGSWGTVLNEFLLVSHDAGGQLKPAALQAGGAVQSSSVTRVSVLSQSAYNALGSKDSSTLYIIT